MQNHRVSKGQERTDDYIPKHDRHVLPDFWYKYSYKIFCRDKFTCQMCLCVKEAKELVAHHIVHRREGGNNEMKNLITLCKECHKKLHKLDWSKNL